MYLEVQNITLLQETNASAYFEYYDYADTYQFIDFITAKVKALKFDQERHGRRQLTEHVLSQFQGD